VNVTLALASRNIPSNSVLAGPSPVITKCTSFLTFQISKYALAKHLRFFSQLTRPTYNNTTFSPITSSPHSRLTWPLRFRGSNNAVSTPRCQIRMRSGNPCSNNPTRVLGEGHIIASHCPCRYLCNVHIAGDKYGYPKCLA